MTTLVKPTVLHFTTVQIVDLPRPQNPVKQSVFEHLARKSQRNSGGDPAPGRTFDPLEKTSDDKWWVAIGRGRREDEAEEGGADTTLTTKTPHINVGNNSILLAGLPEGI